MERIAIIGLGQIGGSIALALKRSNVGDVQVAGTARTRDTLRKAEKLRAIDVAEPGPAEAAAGARLVIIACPILATEVVLAEIAPVLAAGAVVTDVGSTKANVMRWAKQHLPAHAHFVGGHPMAGKESPGIDAADPDLFAGKTWVLVPSVDAGEEAMRTVLGLVQVCGATPVYMDAEEHDSYVAAISHLPLALSSALFSVVFGSAAWPELAQLASSGFRDTTRLASGSPEMAHDIMMSNRENVLHWIDRFQEELARFREAIATGDSKQVLETFGRPQMERDNFVHGGPPKRDTGAPPAEKISLGDMLFGTKLAGYLRKQEELLREKEGRQ